MDSPAAAPAVDSATSGRAAQHLASPQELRDLRAALCGTSASNDTCRYAIRRLISDIWRAPSNMELRILHRDGQDAREKILIVSGAEALLKGIGFEDNSVALELPRSVKQGRLELVLQVLA